MANAAKNITKRVAMTKSLLAGDLAAKTKNDKKQV
jgi:hypothetical protein